MFVYAHAHSHTKLGGNKYVTPMGVGTGHMEQDGMRT